MAGAPVQGLIALERCRQSPGKPGLFFVRGVGGKEQKRPKQEPAALPPSLGSERRRKAATASAVPWALREV